MRDLAGNAIQFRLRTILDVLLMMPTAMNPGLEAIEHQPNLARHLQRRMNRTDRTAWI